MTWGPLSTTPSPLAFLTAPHPQLILAADQLPPGSRSQPVDCTFPVLQRMCQTRRCQACGEGRSEPIQVRLLDTFFNACICYSTPAWIFKGVGLVPVAGIHQSTQFIYLLIILAPWRIKISAGTCLRQPDGSSRRHCNGRCVSESPRIAVLS